MPFHNLNNGLPNFNCNNYDFTIIGAGAVGILLAVKLSSKGKSVLLIESGHFEIDEERQALNEVVNTSKKLTSAVWGRKRAIGGTTLAWGGQSLPFSEFDFVKKKWVKESGWPITYKDIEPYYPIANSFMGIDGLNYSTDIFPKIKLTPPNLGKDVFNYHVSKWANEPNFQKLYWHHLEQHVTVLYNATVKSIKKNNEGLIERISVGSFSPTLLQLGIKKLIIAAGAIETSRMVLANKLFDEASTRVAGKYFMEHPCCEVGWVETQDNYRIQKTFNTHVWRGMKYSIRISTSDSLQTSEHMLNGSASFLFVIPDDKFNFLGELKSISKKKDWHKVFTLFKHIPTIIKTVFGYQKDRFFYKTNAENRLVLMVEQEPLAESYISLTNQPDRFDTPVASVNWEISYKTWESVCKMCDNLKNEIERAGFGKVNIFPQFNLANTNWKKLLSDVNHHMGGCRMGANKETSVVDKDLKVWGTQNLFLCGCAVFPTSSHSNPTLTALALGARLVDKLLNDENTKLK